jgi:diacylglycerol kinase family enzyme
VAGRHVLFIVNRQAGSGRSSERLRRRLEHLPGFSARQETAEVRSLDEARDALRGLAPDAVPVAAGGDGIVGLVASALLASGMSHRPLAILPLGTSNLLARALGLRDARDALSALDGGKPCRIDVMRTSHPSAPVAVVSISTGFEGRFLARYGRIRRYGRALGALSALTEAWGRASPVALELDGETLLAPEDVAYSAGLYNTPSYVGGLVMSPDADASDGVGESVVYRNATAYWAAVARGACGGSLRPRAGVMRRRWRRARLESQSPLQIDGEPYPPGAVSVWIEAAALTVLVPAEAPGLPGTR